MHTILIVCAAAAAGVVPLVCGIIVTDPTPLPTDYKYAYQIEDPTTGDSKSQHEVRHGDTVSGAYSLVAPDATKRTVHYTADSKHGFRAVVREEPPEQTTQPMRERIPYVITSSFNKNPLYTSVDPQLAYPYPDDDETNVYFTPENEIPNDEARFADGKYFHPAK